MKRERIRIYKLNNTLYSIYFIKIKIVQKCCDKLHSAITTLIQYLNCTRFY